MKIRHLQDLQINRSLRIILGSYILEYRKEYKYERKWEGMEQEKCFRCERSGEEAKLLDAVYENEMVKICEECSLIEDIPIIRKPSSFQLEESEKSYSVRERLNRIAGIKEEKPAEINLDKLRKPKDYKEILDEKFKLAKRRNVPVNLIDNYNWSIMMARKERKMTRKQLSEAICEPEEAIKKIENKELLDDALRIIAKIEQYFGIRLRKDGGKINEFSSLIRKQEKAEEKPAMVLKFDPETAKNITLADLKKMKEEKEKIQAIEKAGASAVKEKVDVNKIVWQAEKKKQGKEKPENGGLTGLNIEFVEEE